MAAIQDLVLTLSRDALRTTEETESLDSWIDKSRIFLLYMQMSDLTNISIPCKAHLNMKIEHALYKFITIISITVLLPLNTSPIVIISLGVITPCSCAVFVSETTN